MKKLLVPLLLLSTQAFAMNLDGAYNAATENNPELRAQKYTLDNRKWEKTKAMADFIPHLSASFSHDFDHKYQEMDMAGFGSVPVILPISELSLRADLNIFEGFNGVNSYQAADFGYRAEEHDYRRREFALKRQVRTAYYEALGAQILAEVADQKIKSLESHYNNMQANFRSGYATKYDILKAEVQLADAKTEKILADDKIQVQKEKLAKILGVPAITEPLDGDLPSVEKITISQESLTKGTRDDIEALQLREQQSQKLSAAAKSWWAPSIDLFAEKQYYNNIDDEWTDTDHYKDAYFVGLNLRWKFFDGGASYAQQRIAANNSRITSEHLRSSTMDAERELMIWQRKFTYSVELYKSKKLNIDRSEQAVFHAKAGVRAGTRTNEDVLNTELEFFQSKERMVQAKIDAVEALGQLELAAGTDLM